MKDKLILWNGKKELVPEPEAVPLKSREIRVQGEAWARARCFPGALSVPGSSEQVPRQIVWGH